jgi:hypothetical protein
VRNCCVQRNGTHVAIYAIEVIVSRTPVDIPFDELAAAARAASERADSEARRAGLKVAGKVAEQSAVVLTLGAHMCKWPIGDPSSDGFTFCGRRASDESPYCVDHARIAYSPSKSKTSKTPSQQNIRGGRRA